MNKLKFFIFNLNDINHNLILKRQVAPEHSGYASMIAALMITIGVITGLQFTKILELIVLA